MQEHEQQSGASLPKDQIKGELLATLADLKSAYGLQRLELAWLVLMSLEDHVRRHEGLEEWVNFTQRLARMSQETITEIDTILHEDAKAHKRYH